MLLGILTWVLGAQWISESTPADPLLPSSLIMRPQNALAPLLALASIVRSTQIVLTNDDGWAVAQIRAQKDALTAAGHKVRLLSIPRGECSPMPFYAGHSVCTCRGPVWDRLIFHHALPSYESPYLTMRIQLVPDRFPCNGIQC